VQIPREEKVLSTKRDLREADTAVVLAEAPVFARMLLQSRR
jgi:hypothetical protein